MSSQSTGSKTSRDNPGPRPRKRFPVCRREDLPPGARLLVEVDGKSVGLFNVDGSIYALHNRCPHMGGPLCEGPVAGTALPTDNFHFEYGMEGRILRCAWHGWEFEISTGECLVPGRLRARSYPVTVEQGQVIVHI